MGETVNSNNATNFSNFGFPPVASLLPRSQADPILDAVAEQSDPYTSDKGDIWLDAPVIQYLQALTLPANISPAESARVKRRASGYVWREDKLYRKLKGIEPREVPRPEARKDLVLEMHQRTGH
jgi:hypothetical protein